MATKAAKLRAKRGRPRIADVPREPNGRIVRSGVVGATLAAEAATWKRRQENPSLTVEEARKQEHGSVIHQWHDDWNRMRKGNPDAALQNQFTKLHLEAAERYHELYLSWLAAIDAKTSRSSSDFSGPGGHDGSDPFDADKARRYAWIEESFKEARRAILESGPFGMMAVEAIIIENQPADQLRGDLRIALNRLSCLWKLQDIAVAC